jgi:hypothetical protein
MLGDSRQRQERDRRLTPERTGVSGSVACDGQRRTRTGSYRRCPLQCIEEERLSKLVFPMAELIVFRESFPEHEAASEVKDAQIETRCALDGGGEGRDAP